METITAEILKMVQAYYIFLTCNKTKTMSSKTQYFKQLSTEVHIAKNAVDFFYSISRFMVAQHGGKFMKRSRLQMH